MTHSGSVLVDANVDSARDAAAERSQARRQRMTNSARLFFGDANIAPRSNDDPTVQVGVRLAEWISGGSWSDCARCGSAISKGISETALTRGRYLSAGKCPCLSPTYSVPLLSDWPDCLRNLTREDQSVLSVYRLKYGSAIRMRHGYRCKDGPVYATICEQSVLDSISAVESQERRDRLTRAYVFLCGCPDSAYGDFVRRHDLGDLPERLNCDTLFSMQHVETAMWPLLYPFRALCETAITDTGSHKSAKRSYVIKLLSGVYDYSSSFELLRFQFDRWLYKTVSGAISSARVFDCSPARAMDSKTFSPTYWEWQLSFIVDAVRQFGFPDVFITISPYEWSFPGSEVISRRLRALGKGPTELATVETLHIAHVLTEVMRHFVSGRGKRDWRTNLLHDSESRGCNVKTYFYRYEFQQRGTMHVHYLAWLNDPGKIDVAQFSADFPDCDEEFAHLVYNTQKSRQPVRGLVVTDAPSQVDCSSGRPVLSLRRSQSAHSVNLRVYARPLLEALRCSMDVQMTDGHGMLLKYVASYVSKFREHSVPREILFSDLSAQSVAYRYLRDLCPAEPEMITLLADVKMAYTCSDTKRYLVPSLERVHDDEVLKAYCRRPPSMENATLFQYLRQYTVARGQGHPRRSNKSLLLGVKFVNMFTDLYFFQDALMNTCFRRVSDLFHPHFAALPVDVKMFSFGVQNRCSYWQDRRAVEATCQQRASRKNYVYTLWAYLVSLFQVWNAYFAGRLTYDELNVTEQQLAPATTLSPVQAAFVNCVVERVRRSTNPESVDSADEDEAERYHLLCGSQGTGKSLCIKEIIRQVLEMSCRVLLLGPTGLLAASYKASFGRDLETDTVHAAFGIAVDQDTRSRHNWELRQYDLIVIDEISMVSLVHGDHIAETLHFATKRSVILLCGDKWQLQPVPVRGVVGSLFSHRRIMGMCDRMTLTRQFRTTDVVLSQFLEECRYRKPSDESILAFSDGLVLLEDQFPTDEDLVNVYREHSDYKVLTYTRCATRRFNVAVCKYVFENERPLLQARYPTAQSDLSPVYRGMRVMITENRQKKRGYVNGQTGEIDSVIGKTIMLRIGENKLLRLYPITSPEGVYYPICLAYASTIHKVQGQTLQKAILWFDHRRMPSGCAYVAVSRVRRRDDLRFLTAPRPFHFAPAQGQ